VLSEEQADKPAAQQAEQASKPAPTQASKQQGKQAGRQARRDIHSHAPPCNFGKLNNNHTAPRRAGTENAQTTNKQYDNDTCKTSNEETKIIERAKRKHKQICVADLLHTHIHTHTTCTKPTHDKYERKAKQASQM